MGMSVSTPVFIRRRLCSQGQGKLFVAVLPWGVCGWGVIEVCPKGVGNWSVWPLEYFLCSSRLCEDPYWVQPTKCGVNQYVQPVSLIYEL